MKIRTRARGVVLIGQYADLRGEGNRRQRSADNRREQPHAVILAITSQSPKTAVGGIYLFLNVERRVIGLVQLLEFLHPLLTGILTEGPLLPAVIPIVGIEFLSVLPVFSGQVVLALIVEPHSQLKAGIGLHFGCRAGLHTTRKFLIGERVLAVIAVA